MRTELFDYLLPEELIAYHPPEKRDGGRLLVLDPVSGRITHSHVANLPDFLPERATIIGNNTKVIPARVQGRRPTGGAVEVLFVRAVQETDSECTWLCLCRANKPLKIDDTICLGDTIEATVLQKGHRGETHLHLNGSSSQVATLMDVHGEIPLPPYIRRQANDADKERYQTVFATHSGSVAAPTAGLHFSDELIERVTENGHRVHFVTLHVGPGTFRPITADTLDGHKMDEEYYCLESQTISAIDDAKTNGNSIIAVGTTTVRALEGSASANGGKLVPGDGFTDIFISPSYQFHVVDGLLTNFHLPKSTLLCLVSALAGRDNILAAYEEAVREKYKFYSYGDAMLILPRKS